MSELKKIWFNGKVYYADARLQELRNVENPNDSYTFEKYCEIREAFIERLGVSHIRCETCQIRTICPNY